MRAFDAEVVDAVWAAVEPLIPARTSDQHPLGCHRPRVPDRVCFEGILIRLVTGCAWVDVEHLLGNQVSDTTLRDRRDEWIAAGGFERLADEAVAGYDRVVGLDFSECSVDGSQHKAPAGGEGTGPSPVDRGKRGWKWSLFADRHGIPIAWTTAGANRNDCVLLEPTLDAVASRGLLIECETLHLDRGYDNGIVRGLSVLSTSISSAPRSAKPAPPPPRSLCPSGCAGRSNAPTAGSQTSDSSAATPTGSSSTDSPSSPSRCCSPPSSSTGGTDGATDGAYPLRL